MLIERILIVDDDPDIAQLVKIHPKIYLRKWSLSFRLLPIYSISKKVQRQS